MISYKNWKTLNESFGGVIGLAQPQNLGIIADVPTEEELIAEMKKKLEKHKAKMKKKMLGDVEGGEGGEGEGDGEVVPPSAKKDKDPDADEKAAADSEDGEEKPKDDADVDHEDGEDNDDSGAAKELMMMKKKMKKEAAELAEAKKENPFAKFIKKADGKGDKEDKKEDKGGNPFAKKDDKKCDKKEDKKEIKKEDVEFWNSLQTMMVNNLGQKNWDGFTPIGELEVGVRNEGEPVAGAVGFAPQGKIGA